MYAVISFVTVGLMVAALVDIIPRDSLLVRHLPKLTWVFLVLLLPVIGSILWFALGHDWGDRREVTPFGDPRRQGAAAERIRNEYHVDEAALEADLRLGEKEARIRHLEAEIAAKREQRGETA